MCDRDLRSALYRSLVPAAWLLLSLAGSAAQTSTHSAQAPSGVRQNATGAAKSYPPHWSRAGAPFFGKIVPFVMAATPAAEKQVRISPAPSW